MNLPWPLQERVPALLALVFPLFPLWALGASAADVVIEKYTYQPREVAIHAGDTVTWINREKRTSHSILFPEEGGMESPRLFPDETWQRVFDRAGRYPYVCGPHPEMKGVVIVTD